MYSSLLFLLFLLFLLLIRFILPLLVMLSSTRLISLALLLVSTLNVAAAPTPLAQDGDLVERQLPRFVCYTKAEPGP